MTLLLCRRCNRTKDTDEFYPDRSRHSGRDAYCKLCRKAQARETMYNKRHGLPLRISKREALGRPRKTNAEHGKVWVPLVDQEIRAWLLRPARAAA